MKTNTQKPQCQAEPESPKLRKKSLDFLNSMGVLLSWHESCWKGTNRERKGEDEGQPRLETNSGNYCSAATAAAAGGFPSPRPYQQQITRQLLQALVNSIPTETASFPRSQILFACASC